LETVPRDLYAGEWLDALNDARLTAEQVGTGLKRARAESDYAPGIASFIRFCRDSASDEQRALYARLSAADAGRKALPHGTWEDRQAAGRRELPNLRAALSHRRSK
jgi:hypothetical protein